MYSVFDASEMFYKVKKSVQELAPLLVKYKIKGINPPAELLENPKAAREAAKCVSDNGLKWGLLPTPADLFAPDVTDDMFDIALEKLKIWADTGQKMGVKYSYNHIFPGHNERDYWQNFSWHIIRLQKINKIMADNGIHYGLEFIAPWDLRVLFKYPFTTTISGVLAIADAVDPGIGVLFDTYHWFTSGGNPDDLSFAAQHVDRIVCFHINDGVEGLSYKEQKDMTRALPMTTGVIDSVTPYKMFLEKGYKGPVIIEPMFPIYETFKNSEAEEVVKTIADSYNNIKRLAEEKRI